MPFEPAPAPTTVPTTPPLAHPAALKLAKAIREAAAKHPEGYCFGYALRGYGCCAIGAIARELRLTVGFNRRVCPIVADALNIPYDLVEEVSHKHAEKFKRIHGPVDRISPDAPDLRLTIADSLEAGDFNDLCK